MPDAADEAEIIQQRSIEIALSAMRPKSLLSRHFLRRLRRDNTAGKD